VDAGDNDPLTGAISLMHEAQFDAPVACKTTSQGSALLHHATASRRYLAEALRGHDPPAIR
jgi:hypothetical protein